MKANGITVIKGDAKLAGCHEISVTQADSGLKTILAKSIVIATGSKTVGLPIEGADLAGVIDSTALLDMDHIPDQLTIIGGGVIGIEFAAIFNAFGSDVTVIEFLPNLLAQIDSDISKRLVPMMKKKGIKILTSSKVEKIEKQENKLMITVSTSKGDLISVEADQVLMAVGRQPKVDELTLENAGVIYDKKGIKTNHFGQTNVPNIYAIGDVTGGIMLAHYCIPSRNYCN